MYCNYDLALFTTKTSSLSLSSHNSFAKCLVTELLCGKHVSVITFHVSGRNVYWSCICVCPLPHAALLHRPGCNLPLVVHCWADLQSAHKFHFCDNIAQTQMSASACTHSMTGSIIQKDDRLTINKLISLENGRLVTTLKLL